ncbi:hypothetical protein Vadar_032776 [Vaccinium darrowii]|nr:hypothetical protein Vadar_032776 [Vaccinium darrowii]
MNTGKNSLQILHVLLTVVLQYLNPALAISSSTIRCIERERQALLKFKEALIIDYNDGFGVLRLSSWGSTKEEDCCKWEGVHCSNHNTTSHVTMLDLCTRDAYLPLRGKISPSLLELQHLRYLDFSANDFDEISIPKFIGSLSRLRYLNLAHSGFSGSIPHQFSNLSNLRYLDLHNNHMLNTENLEWLSPLSLLTHLDLSGVLIFNAAGWVQSISNLPLLKELHLSECSLVNIALFSSFHFNSSVSLSIVDLSYNSLSSSIYNWLFNFSSSLVDINLSNNELKGNNLSEELHEFLQKLSGANNSLDGLDSSDNQLKALVESKNSDATTSFGYTEGNGIWDVDITYVANAFVQWKGQDQEYGTNLRLQKTIDLSSNSLSGKIPEQVGSLAGLHSLNLSRNTLTGKIMEGIGQMEMLESLDLSANMLSGEIPRSLAHLNFLSVLNLSSNNLSGKIPLSTQLQGFNASAYSGNPELCGLPLPKKCLGEEATAETPIATHVKDKSIEQDEDRSNRQGFYASMGLGFFFGFWGVFGTILFNSRSRHAYFKFLNYITDWIYVTTALNWTRLQRL